MQKSVEPQPALRYGQGRFRAVLTFSSRPGGKASETIVAAATLLRECELVLQEAVEEGVRRKRRPLSILVALKPYLLAEGPQPTAAHRALCAESPSVQADEADVLVQIAAETEDERTYALRLVKRTLGRCAELMEQFYGGRHTIGREPFGYQDAGTYDRAGRGLSEGPQVPLALNGDGATWLAYQDCRQDLEQFFALSGAEQDAVMGRKRDPDPERPFAGAPNSHAVHAKSHDEALLRRSMSYERYTEAGLVFLAVAASPARLGRALERFRSGDRLSKYVELRNGGLFVVPPSAHWLVGDQQLPTKGTDIPPMEVNFYPKAPLVLYEMTPATLEFFLRVFHDNKDNFDDAGVLRPDLQLLGKGLAKLLYGARIDSDSRLFKALGRLFEADTCGRALDELSHRDTSSSREAAHGASKGRVSERLRDAMEGASRERRRYEAEKALLVKRSGRGKVNARELAVLRDAFQKRNAPFQQVIRDELANQRVARAAIDGSGLEHTSVVDLYAEMIEIDAESVHGLDVKRREELANIIELCKEAADEARELNESVGKYMTFVC